MVTKRSPIDVSFTAIAYFVKGGVPDASLRQLERIVPQCFS
ncbi:hypothetical protein [Burkholderia sp. Bp8998]|nr:hypothetical protein [Burkholderia sp. Bp8998]